ncbi:DUF3558 domain-containing protein [Amycolatopsis sp. lyj-109]|uniref:DUF3558 domain-containing protein n=1 Tax=Amycolatopsis sp. lyj-109 TaxID=2789287 RepID=UPI0039790A61
MRAKVAVVLSVAALVAGCSNDVVGRPSPSAGGTDSPSPAGESSDVPKVAHPIDTSRYEREPCSALSADQLSQLGIKTEPKSDLAAKGGPGCEWNAYDDIGWTVGARLLTAGSSLANLYEQHAQGAWPFFEPVPDVSGYPGVLLESVETRPKSVCGMSVALRDDMIYSVQIRIDPQKEEANDPCPVVRKIAEMAVSTMKAGA